MTVTGAAARHTRLHDAVDVQARSDEVASGVDHVAMTGFATAGLWVGRRGRQAVASPAGLVTRSRLGPHRVASFAVTRAARTGPPHHVVARMPSAALRLRSEHDLRRASTSSAWPGESLRVGTIWHSLHLSEPRASLLALR